MKHWLKLVNTVTNLFVIELAKTTDITHFSLRNTIHVYFRSSTINRFCHFFLKTGLNIFRPLWKMFPLTMSEHEQKGTYLHVKFGFPVFFHFSCNYCDKVD